MFKLVGIFFIGMLISFLGTLPLGSLNVSAMQVAITENVKKAIQFSLGVALVEILYVRLSLQGIDWVVAHQQLFYILQWVTVFLFLVLGVSSLWTARKNDIGGKNLLLNNRMSRFWLGFTMSAVNPVQIPFWFIWSTYLLSNHVLQPTPAYFNTYTVGIGAGTLIGLGVFVFAGKWLLNKLKTSNRAIHIIVGVVFLVSAAIQFYRVLYKPFSLDKGKQPTVAVIDATLPITSGAVLRA